MKVKVYAHYRTKLFNYISSSMSLSWQLSRDVILMPDISWILPTIILYENNDGSHRKWSCLNRNKYRGSHIGLCHFGFLEHIRVQHLVRPHWSATHHMYNRMKMLQSVVKHSSKFCSLMCVNQWPNNTI